MVAVGAELVQERVQLLLERDAREVRDVVVDDDALGHEVEVKVHLGPQVIYNGVL